MPPTKWMSQKEYVRTDGALCPACGSNDVAPREATFYPGGVSQVSECLACGAVVRDLYSLTGYEKDLDKQ